MRLFIKSFLNNYIYNSKMESLILSLLDIENIYLKYEKKERLSHIPKRIGGWLAKVSTKYDLPFSKNHRYLAISVIFIEGIFLT